MRSVRDKIIASRDRRAIKRCFCCQQKQNRALVVAINTDRWVMEVIAIKIIFLPLAYKTSAHSRSFYGISRRRFPNFNSQS